MKRIICTALFCLLSSFAYAAEPIQDLDAFEVKVKSCLLKMTKDSRCFQSILLKQVVPGNEEQLLPSAKQLDEFSLKWLDKHQVFAIHPVATKKTGDIFQTNTYLIEDDTGALMIFTYSVIKRLGKWYVSYFSVNSTDEAVGALLKGK